MRSVALMAAVALCGLACSSPAPPAVPDAGDTSVSDASPPDADPPPADAAGDTSPDAPLDASPDAPRDASPDAPDATTCPIPCVADTPCRTALCDTTTDPSTPTCVKSPAPDGTLCGESDTLICVASACVTRRCGDGYREPASSPRREGCDDGNTDDDDACSSTCTPSTAVVAADASGDYHAWPAERGVAVAADGRGELLFVWTHDGLSSGALGVRARRHTRGGAPLPAAADPLVLDDLNFQDPEPQVAGLAAGGWVVVWNDDRSGTEREVSYRLIAADGTMGPLRTANQTREGPQYESRVVATSTGFVIAWTNLLPTVDERGKGVLARRFSPTGASLGDEFAVATERRNDQSDPYLAASGTGDEWIVLFTHFALAPGSRPTLYGRRFRGATPLDAAQFVVSPMMEGAVSAVASLGSGAYAAAWVEMSNVYARVIPAGDPTADPTMLLTASATMAFETHPSVASLGGGAFLVTYQADSGARQHYDFATSPGATLPPEAAEVRTALTARGVRRASVARVPDGVWFVWAGYVPGYDADVLHAHFVPID